MSLSTESNCTAVEQHLPKAKLDDPANSSDDWLMLTDFSPTPRASAFVPKQDRELIQTSYTRCPSLIALFASFCPYHVRRELIYSTILPLAHRPGIPPPAKWTTA